MEKLNHRVELHDLAEHRELLSVKRNQYGDLLFELEGGLIRQFTPQKRFAQSINEMKLFPVERVSLICKSKKSLLSIVRFQNPIMDFFGDIRDIQTPQAATPDKPKKSRPPVTVADAATLCGVSVSLIKKWGSGDGTPHDYPGRYNRVSLVAWATNRKAEIRTKHALNKRAGLGDGKAADREQAKIWKGKRDANMRSEEE